jgi:hypothetical protein
VTNGKLGDDYKRACPLQSWEFGQPLNLSTPSTPFDNTTRASACHFHATTSGSKADFSSLETPVHDLYVKELHGASEYFPESTATVSDADLTLYS